MQSIYHLLVKEEERRGNCWQRSLCFLKVLPAFDQLTLWRWRHKNVCSETCRLKPEHRLQTVQGWTRSCSIWSTAVRFSFSLSQTKIVHLSFSFCCPWLSQSKRDFFWPCQVKFVLSYVRFSFFFVLKPVFPNAAHHFACPAFDFLCLLTLQLLRRIFKRAQPQRWGAWRRSQGAY